jgi:integrase
MVALGVNPKTAQKRLGHADVRTTLEIYTKATDEADRDAATKLGQKFMPPTPQADEAAGGEGG